MATVVLLSSVVSVAPSSAWAQARATTAAEPPGGIDYGKAFQQGLDEFEAGNVGAAAQTWERLLVALGEERGYKVCYNLGLAYQRLGDATHAIERFESFAARAATEASRDAALEERRQDALERIRAIKASHGALKIAASPERQVVLVRVGSAEARPAGFVVYLAPGEHDVELYSGTSRARRVKVVLAAGATKQLAIDGEAGASGSAPPTDGDRASSRFPTGWLIAGIAVTAASCAVPIAFAVDTSSKRSDAVALGPGNTGYADALNRFDDARARYEISWILPAAFAVATAAIVIVEVVGKSSSGTTTARRRLDWSRVAF